MVDHETRGSQLSKKTKKRSSFSFFNDRNARIILKAPFSTLLDISTSSGDIEVLGSEAKNILSSTSGAVRIQSGSGKIPVRFSTTSGNIEID